MEFSKPRVNYDLFYDEWQVSVTAKVNKELWLGFTKEFADYPSTGALIHAVHECRCRIDEVA